MADTTSPPLLRLEGISKRYGATLALNNATLPFVVALAQKGTHRALQDDAHLLNGLNVARGVITCGSVAEAHGLPFQSAAGVLEHLS